MNLLRLSCLKSHDNFLKSATVDGFVYAFVVFWGVSHFLFSTTKGYSYFLSPESETLYSVVFRRLTQPAFPREIAFAAPAVVPLVPWAL